jgi:hypothetical protein
VKQVYRSVPDPARLLARERDPGSGRRLLTRQDKGQQRALQSAARRRPRSWAVAVIAVVAVVGLAGVAIATRGSGSDDEVAGSGATAARDGVGAAAAGTGDEGAGGEGTGAGPTTTATDPPATAISLTYAGGTATRQDCTDLLGQGDCATVEYNEFDPLAVRCTPEGCQVTFIGQPVDLAGGVATSGTAPHAPGCGTQQWTLDLRAVGTTTTRGIEHPARLVGRATTEAPASVTPTLNCLGRSEVYEYDAAPG